MRASRPYRPTLPLLHYLALDALRAQGWTAPLLAFLAATVLLDAGGGPALGDYASTAATLLPVALWLTIVVNRGEDRVQAAVTVVTAASPGRVYLAKLALAFAAAAILGLVAVVWPATSGRLAATHVGTGLLAHLATALTGVGIGALLSPPVLQRTGVAAVAGVAVTLADVLVPYAPPAWQILDLLSGDHPQAPATRMLAVVAESLVLAVAAVLVARVLARRRS